MTSKKVMAIVPRINIASVAALLMAASLNVSAQGFVYPDVQEDRPGGFTITPMIGQFSLDSDRGLDDETYFGLGLGYRFSNPYAVEFVYIDADANTNSGASVGDLRQFRLEMLYDVAEYGNWTPYVAVGAATTEFGTTTTADDEGAYTLGFGTHYSLSERIALRFDTRYLRGVGDSKGADLTYALGLNVFLGKTSAPVEKPQEIKTIQRTEAPAVAAAKPSLADLCQSAGGELSGVNCLKKTVSVENVELKVQFQYKSDKVDPDYLGEVEELADFLKNYTASTVEIGGHTDSIGSDAYNKDLSQRRVNEVARLLSENYGIDAARVSSVGYGESQPIAPNNTDANRAKNRRVVATMTVQNEEVVQLDIK